MSSLAAARADNFYYPPGFDPDKHGSLNKFQGQHPLRDRARKLATEGILIIRFEVPFNIWCDKCGEHIAKGVRFNADKKQVGNYHSTKIWAFTMRHHCGGRITIQTDPKAGDYVVTQGARRKVESYKAEDAQTVEIPDAAERAAVSADPLARLEHSTASAARAAGGRATLVALARDAAARGTDPYSLNKQLRAALRASKKSDAQLDERRQQLGLPEHVKLLPETTADAQTAAVALLQRQGSRFDSAWRDKRRGIMSQPVLVGSAAGTGGAGHSATVPASHGSSSSRKRLHAGVTDSSAAAAAARVGARPPSAKELLAQRVLASKRRKALQATRP